MDLHINHQWLPTSSEEKQLDIIFFYMEEHMTTYEAIC